MQGAVQGAEVHTPAKVLVRASYTREGSCARVLQWRCVHNTLPFALCCRFDDSVQILSFWYPVFSYIEYFNPVFITSSTSTRTVTHTYVHTHTHHTYAHTHTQACAHTHYDLHLPYTHTCVHANVNSMHSTPPADTGSIHRWCYRKRRFSLQERKPL